MTARERSAAQAMVAKFTARLGQTGAELIPTTELSERLRSGERIVLVDVRTPEEQMVSMIPGAVTREVFEEEVLPTLKDEKATSPLIVPYCTVGYRSGLYCKELVDDHGLPSVRNGEGVILWTFDGDG